MPPKPSAQSLSHVSNVESIGDPRDKANVVSVSNLNIKENMKADVGVIFSEGVRYRDRGVSYMENIEAEVQKKLEAGEEPKQKLTRQQYQDRFASKSGGRTGRGVRTRGVSAVSGQRMKPDLVDKLIAGGHSPGRTEPGYDGFERAMTQVGDVTERSRFGNAFPDEAKSVQQGVRFKTRGQRVRKEKYTTADGVTVISQASAHERSQLKIMKANANNQIIDAQSIMNKQMRMNSLDFAAAGGD